MNESGYEAACRLVTKTYVQRGQEAKKTHEKKVQILLQQCKLPEFGWSDLTIELFLQELAIMDSNNFSGNVGVGEREARIASRLVAKRHYQMGHGIGRSGDITAIQPKATGSSLMSQLTNAMLLNLLRKCGVPSVSKCVLIPVATGMAMMLVLLTLRQQRPQARYVLWPRIDQKSCFKCILSAGLEPVVINNLLEGDELRTDLKSLESSLRALQPNNVLCVLTTTSCFAPRAPDKLAEVGRLCKSLDVPHIVNNAYGVQSTKCMNAIQEATRVGRVDAFVQSTDKNLMVPVGGAIVASQSKDFINAVAQMYPGRGSSSPTMDVFITLLSLGWNGYKKLLQERKDNFQYLWKKLEEVATKYGEHVLVTPHNPISIGISLGGLALSSVELTEFGSMLFIRHVSGIRVVAPGSMKSMGPHSLVNWGAHYDDYPTPYFTVAAAIGITRRDVDNFAIKLGKVFIKFIRKHIQKEAISEDVSEAIPEGVKTDPDRTTSGSLGDGNEGCEEDDLYDTKEEAKEDSLSEEDLKHTD